MKNQNKIKVADYITNFLIQKGIKYTFGYIGGAITFVIDSIDNNEKIKFIQTYHEQTAAIAAEGYSRNSDSIGVALATSGPGATNLITGIADAYFDSIPCMFITGQVNTGEYKYQKKIRQQGFQETDIVQIVKPIIKYSKLVDSAQEICYELEKAYQIAKEGRAGPVLLDIPMNIQKEIIDINKIKKYIPDLKKLKPINFSIIKEVIDKSQRPIILAGGGIIKSKAEKELILFATKYKIPVVTSLMGKGSFPEDNELFIGMIGSYGNRAANVVLANSDLVFAIGSRLDTRQTGTNISSFIRNGTIIHVDIDENELEDNRLNNRIKINADAKTFLGQINFKNYEYNKWLKYINNIKLNLSQKNEFLLKDINKIPYLFLNEINKISRPNDIFTVDIGQNQMFCAQTLKITKEQKFFTSGGLAPMGYAIPAAIGACFACDNKKRIFAIVGDGGFHISLQSLMLLSQYNLNIKVIVMNNKSLGMITQFQDANFEKRRFATTNNSGYLVPTISEIAKAYNLNYSILKNSSELDKLSIQLIESNKPCIIELLMEDYTEVVPKLEINSPIEDTSPKLSEKELTKHMLIDLWKTKK